MSTTGTSPRRRDGRDNGSALIADALEGARGWHHGQRRASDGAPFIDHPLEVAQLLRQARAPAVVVAAGLLHDVVEKADATPAALESRFGPAVARLVAAVSDPEPGAPFRQRKRQLRAQVERAGGDAVTILAADGISKVRDLRRLAARQPEHFSPHSGETLARLEHYQSCLRMLRRVARGHPLAERLRAELADYSREAEDRLSAAASR